MFLKTIIVFCVVIESLTSAQNFCGTGGESTPLIFGGTPTKQGAWPWIVAIYLAKSNTFRCGGTLISTKNVITAAHCIQPKDNKERSDPLHPTDIVVKLGKYDLSNENEWNSVRRFPNEIIVHPNWKAFGQQYDSDIAMIILESSVEISSTISPICLWSANSEPKTNTGTVVGWGSSETHLLENTPKKLELLIRTNEECYLKDPRLAAISSLNTFCAGKDDNSGPCQGDSGSGLVIRSGSNWFLKGIVSVTFSQGTSCDLSVDVIFTNVLKFTKWINEVSTNKGIALPQVKPVRSKPKKEIFCFFESWAETRSYDGLFTVDHLKPELCTTIVFLHAELDDDKLKSNNEGQQLENGRNLYRRFNALKTRHPQLRTLLSVGSWNEGSVKYSELAADSGRRKRFARNSADFLKKYGFDGLHFHWEYPGHRGGSDADKQNFVLLLQDLQNVFKQENLYLSALIRTQTDVVANAYDLKEIGKYVDAMLMTTFDFEGPWNGKVGFTARLRGEGFSDDNVENRVDFFIDEGAPVDKMILGLPFYGRTFITDNEGNPGDDTKDNRGFQGPYFKEKGFLGFNEICRLQKIHEWEVSFDPEASQAIGKFKYDNLTKVTTYDTPRSVANKVKFMMEKNLGGVWTWFVDSDDFRGKCKPDLTTFADFPQPTKAPRKEKDYPLLRTVNEAIEMMSRNDISATDWKGTGR